MGSQVRFGVLDADFQAAQWSYWRALGLRPPFSFWSASKAEYFAKDGEDPRSTPLEVSSFQVRGFPSDFRERLVWGGWKAQTLDVEHLCHVARDAAAVCMVPVWIPLLLVLGRARDACFFAFDGEAFLCPCLCVWHVRGSCG